MATTERQDYDRAVKDGETTLGYAEWLAETEDTKVIEFSDIKITDFHDASSPEAEYSSQVWTLLIGDETYKYERWVAGSGSGSNWWDDDDRGAHEVGEWIVLGQPTGDLVVDTETESVVNVGHREVTLDEVIDEISDKAANAYYGLYSERIQPLVDQIKKEVFPFVVTP